MKRRACRGSMFPAGVMMAALTCLVTGCTYTKSFVDLRLERAVKDNDYAPISPAEHFLTPGSIAIVDDSAVAVLCDWPSVFSDIPQVVKEATIAQSRFVASGLEVRASEQPVIKALRAFYEVKNITIGPITETRIDPNKNRSEVTPACGQKIRDAIAKSGGDDDDEAPALIEGTWTVDVTYHLQPTTPKLANAVKPVLPEIVGAFGNFRYQPDTESLAGRLVLGYVAADTSPEVLASTRSDPAPEQSPVNRSLAGTWTVARWDEDDRDSTSSRIPKPKGKIVGSLLVIERDEQNAYDGVLTLVVDGRNQVLQELQISVDGDRVQMDGNVIKGSWLDDNLKLRLRGGNELAGIATSEGVSGKASVTLIRSADDG